MEKGDKVYLIKSVRARTVEYYGSAAYVGVGYPFPYSMPRFSSEAFLEDFTQQLIWGFECLWFPKDKINLYFIPGAYSYKQVKFEPNNRAKRKL